MLWPHVLQDVAIPERGRGMLEDESQLHDLGRRDIRVRPEDEIVAWPTCVAHSTRRASWLMKHTGELRRVQQDVQV